MGNSTRWAIAITATVVFALLAFAQIKRAHACRAHGGVYVRSLTLTGYACIRAKRVG